MNETAGDAQPISTDLSCVSCGYNLRELNRSGRCPECNTPIPRSLRTRYLDGCSAELLRNVRDGALIVAVCMAVGTVRASLVEIGLMIGIKRALLIRLVDPKIILTLLAIECIGAWLIAKTEPRCMERTTIRSAIWLRRLYLLSLGASALYHFFIRGTFIVDFVRAWAIGESLLAIFLTTLFYRYLAGLCRRIPDLVVADQLRTLIWLAPLGVVVGNLFPWVLIFFHMLRLYRTAWLMIGVHLAEYGIDAWGVIVLWQFASALKHMQLIAERRALTPHEEE